MKAHHLRAKRFDHFAGRVIERCPVGHRRRCIEVGAEFLVVGLQQVFPVLCALLIRSRRLMTEEVDVDRASGVLADGFELFAQLIGAEHRRRHRAQAAGIAGGDHHGRVCGTGHRPLDDRQFDPEQVKDAGIWPLVHVLCSPTLNPGRGGRTGFVTQRLAQGQSSFQRVRR
ncbi:MFS family permease [Pseudomonas sp. IT-P258]